MFRAVTSVVSTLSGCVANGHQLNTPVSSSPSKIPYGGFSPVRLQTEMQRPRPSRSRAYTRPPPMSRVPIARFRAVRRNALTRPSRPEALGSQAGYAVPPDRRLLWPHLRHSLATARLFPSSNGPHRVFPMAGSGSPLYSACLFQRAIPNTPMDRAAVVSWYAAPPALAFALFVWARLPYCPPLRRFLGWDGVTRLPQVRLRYGPLNCLPATDHRLLRSSFHLPSRLGQASNITTRQASLLPWPDFHRQDTQPCGLRTKGAKSAPLRVMPTCRARRCRG